MRVLRRALFAIPIALALLAVALVVMLWAIRIEQDVAVAGEVNIERYQLVRASQNGVISKLLVEPGESVEPGQSLIELSNPEARLELQSLRRELDQVKVGSVGVHQRLELRLELHPRQIERQRGLIREMDLEIRRRDAEVAEAGHRRQGLEARLQRVAKLFDADLVSAGELEEAEITVRQEEERERQIQLQVDEARERRRSLQEGLKLLRSEQAQEILELEIEGQELSERQGGLEIQLQLLELQADALTLQAEMAGVVTGDSLLDLRGRSVARGESVMSIVDSRSIVVEAWVPEEAIVRLQPGQKASLEIQGLPKQRFRTFTGKVLRIDPRPQEDLAENRTFYAVFLSVDQPWIQWEGRRFYLRDGMRGRAEIVYRSGVSLGRVLVEILTGR